MTDTVEPGPARSDNPALRWTLWVVLVIAVGAAAIALRQTSDERSARHAAAGRGATGLASAPRGAASASSLERTYEMTAGGTFELSAGVGDIEARPAAGTTARVIVSLKAGAPADQVRIVEHEAGAGRVYLSVEPAEAAGGGVRIFSGSAGRAASLGIERVIVELPAGVGAKLSSGAGDLDVEGLGGSLELQTGTGDVVARRCAGVEATTGAGAIELRDIAGSARAQSGAGDISLQNIQGSARVETGAGSVRVSGVTGEVRVESGVGGIEARVQAVTAPIDIETGMGSIELTVAGGGFNLEAESGMGSVTLEAAGQTEKSSGMGGQVRRVLGGGGPAVRLESGAGSIEVKAPASPRPAT